MPQQQLSQYHSISIEYQNSSVQGNSIKPRLIFNLNLTNLAQGSYPLDFEFLPSEVQLGNGFYVGLLMPQVYYGPIQPNNPYGYSFGLDLDFYSISQIEKIREGKDLQLQLQLKFVVKAQAPQPITMSPGMNIPVRIPKSDWVESYLPQLKFRDVFLLEFPKLENAEFRDAVSHLNSAWKQFGLGEYDKVLEECRKALEAAKDTAKTKGLLKEDEVDWEQILEGDRAGSYVSSVHKGVWGFNARGAHIGKSINREDADFALLTTHALFVLLTKKVT